MRAELEPDPPLIAVPYQPVTRALDDAEIGALIVAGDTESRLIIGLLLSGIALDQIAELKCGDFDTGTGVLRTPSQPSRTITIPQALRAEFKHQLSTAVGPDDSIWHDQTGRPRTQEDLEALIMMTARDAGLTEPELATPQGILHSYLVYLVKQGMRLADLENVTGPTAPSERAAYAVHAPQAAAVPSEAMQPLPSPAPPAKPRATSTPSVSRPTARFFRRKASAIC